MRHTTLHILLLAALTASAAERPYLYNPKRISVREHGFVDTIAVTYKDGRVWVPLRIGGRKARFMLDTGAALCTIEQGAAELELTPLGTIARATDANGVSQQARVVALPEMELGSIHITQMPALMQAGRGRKPQSHTSVPHHKATAEGTMQQPELTGTLGFAIIACGLTAKLDLRAGHLILTDRRDYFAAEGGSRVRYRHYLNTPEVPLTLAGRTRERAVLDTGNPHLLLLSAKSLARWQDEGSPVAAQVEATTHGQAFTGAHGMEAMRRVDYVCLDPVAWADVQLHSLRTITTTGPTSIGAALSEHGAIVVDPHRTTITLQPYDNIRDISLTTPYTDIYYAAQQDGRPYVSLVRPGSDQQRQGMHAGDVVEAVNGTPMRTLMQLQRYPFVRGQAYTYTMRRGPVTYEATLIK